MNMNRLAIRAGIAAQFFFLCAAPTLARAQSTQPALVQPPHMISPAVRGSRDAGATDDFAGLKYTPEQQAKVDEIHKRMGLRLTAVAKDEKLSAEQKTAMTQGLRRMERGEVFKQLTPEQQKEVLKNVHVRRAAAQEAETKQSPAK
jgi:hypothetical protein